MAIISVNHSKLRTVAADINTYCSTHANQMKAADTEVKAMLTSDWSGADADEYRKKWSGVDDSNSVSKKLYESLTKFAEALNACADEYQSAQEAVYDEANRLPK